MNIEYSIEFIKETEQLAYYVNDPRDAQKLSNWKSVKTYENRKTGFKAEGFVNEKGQYVLVIAGTNRLSVQDWRNDIQLATRNVPLQAYDAFLAYEDFFDRCSIDEVIIVGYSLGGSDTEIVCNETGAKGITFASYGVGDIVESKYTENIINFGNEGDPIFTAKIDKHLGNTYVIPDESSLIYKGSSISKHLPNKIGDVSKAVKYNSLSYNALDNSYIIDGYVNKNIYNDSIFDSSNKVMYNDDKKLEEMSEEEIKRMVEQYFDNGDRLPEKEEMERRVRFGELIYVEDYVRSDGTHVSGYYRRYPKD